MRQNLLSLSSALSLSLHLLLFEISVSAVGREGTLKGEESGPGGGTAAREQPSRPAAKKIQSGTLKSSQAEGGKRAFRE